MLFPSASASRAIDKARTVRLIPRLLGIPFVEPREDMRLHHTFPRIDHFSLWSSIPQRTRRQEKSVFPAKGYGYTFGALPENWLRGPKCSYIFSYAFSLDKWLQGRVSKLVQSFRQDRTLDPQRLHHYNQSINQGGGPALPRAFCSMRRRKAKYGYSCILESWGVYFSLMRKDFCIENPRTV